MKQPKDIIEEFFNKCPGGFHQYPEEVERMQNWFIQTNIDRLEEEISWLEDTKHSHENPTQIDIAQDTSWNAALDQILTTKKAEKQEWEELSNSV